MINYLHNIKHIIIYSLLITKFWNIFKFAWVSTPDIIQCKYPIHKRINIVYCIIHTIIIISSILFKEHTLWELFPRIHMQNLFKLYLISIDINEKNNQSILNHCLFDLSRIPENRGFPNCIHFCQYLNSSYYLSLVVLWYYIYGNQNRIKK